MITFLFKCISVYAVSWCVWRIVRQYFVKSPLYNIPGPPPESFWKGNFDAFFGLDGWDYHKILAQKYGNVCRIIGFFGKPHLCISDPKALHHIIVKDQNIYDETDEFFAINELIFGGGLLSTFGDSHRRQRKMLNPVFSIAHMRRMIPVFWQVTNKLQMTFAHKVEDGPQEVDILHWMTRTALELIGQSGFGYSFDKLTTDDPEHPFSSSIKMLIPMFFKLFIFQAIVPVTSRIGTPRFRRFIVDHLPWKELHQMRDIVDVLTNTSIEIVESKRRALKEGDEAVSKQIGQGKDIISILLKTNMEAAEEDRLSEDEILGQISTFSFAAMDTTSSALARILHLLAHHTEVQERLREEILETRKKHGNEIGYDELVSMPYLDAVCRETLRLYPPVVMVRRVARQGVLMPLSTPIKGVDGREVPEIFVPKNTSIIVSILSANRSTEIWGADSYEWKPERWLDPLPDTVSEAHMPGIYSHLMTFLGGGRACIGFKFSQLEMKVVLATLLGSFRVSPSEKNVKWNMTGIASPVLRDNKDLRPQLPMVISAI